MNSSVVMPVPLAEIRHISPRIAEAYATLNERTVKRDVDSLVEMELLLKTPEGYEANFGLMLAFIPPKRD